MKIKHLLFALPVLAMGFVSCSNEEETIQYGNGEVVKTEFTIALNGNKVGTRQSQAIVQGQNTPVFRGIQDISLIPFHITGTSVTATDSRLGSSNINLPVSSALPTITGANTIASLNGNTNSQLYKDVEIPLGTNAFLFYGEASHGSYGEKDRGSVVAAAGLAYGNPSGISFELQPIYPDGSAINTATYLVNYLSKIANTTGWSDLASDANNPLGHLYSQFISTKAGASANVLALVQDLYTTLIGNTTDMSTAIKSSIINETYDGTNKAVTSETDGVLTFASALQNWPSVKGLPDGAAYINWSDSKFNVVTTQDNANLNNPALNSYAYPASLYYHANSTLKVHTESLADKYTSSANWENLLTSYTGGSIVGLATRSIIIEKQIEYAVARLDVNVKAASSTLNDSYSKSISLTNASSESSFPITGVLVGNQRTVDFAFNPKDSDYQTYTIYDNAVPNEWALSSSSSVPNHTLVFTSHGEDDDGKVLVAVEFLNNSGEDFNGYGNNLIPNGCKFYLVGELNAKGSVTNDKFGNTIKRVFLQDYITTANFNIKSLKNAYNVVPDLRMPALELGLGVDLNWSEGLNLGVDIE